jgi:hypothetical protein
MVARLTPYPNERENPESTCIENWVGKSSEHKTRAGNPPTQNTRQESCQNFESAPLSTKKGDIIY